MNRLVTLCTLLALLSGSLAGQEKKLAPDERLYRNAIENLKHSSEAPNRKRRARAQFESLFRRYPTSQHASNALLNLALLLDHEIAEERERALLILQRIRNSYPQSLDAQLALKHLERFVSWRFSEVPTTLHPTSSLKIARQGSLSAPSVFELHRVPAAVILSALQTEHRKIEALTKKMEQEPEFFNPPSRSTDLSRLDRSTHPTSWLRIGKELRLNGGFLHGTDEKGKFLKVTSLPPGHYILEEKIQGFRKLHPILVTNARLHSGAQGRNALAYLANPWSGRPIPGVDLWILSSKTRAKQKTDATGCIRFSLPEGDEDHDPETLLMGQIGEQVVMVTVESAAPERKGELVHIQTDRPIYRPGHTIHYRAVLRTYADPQLFLPDPRSVLVELRDPEDRLLAATRRTSNEFGALSGSFRLATEPTLGEYQIRLHIARPEWLDRHSGSAFFDEEENFSPWTTSFQVAAYRKPEFEVRVRFAGSDPDRPARKRATIEVETYFGAPLAGAEVEWSVEEMREYRSEERTERPSPPFEDPLRWFYARSDDSQEEWYWEEYGGNEAWREGSGSTGPDGTIQIDFEPPRRRWQTKYVVNAMVRGPTGRTVEARQEIQLGGGSFRIATGVDRMFYRPGETVQATVRVETSKGAPAPGQTIDWRIFRAEPGSDEFEEIRSAKPTTGTDGRARLSFEAPSADRLRLRARVRDAQGQISTHRSTVWIARSAEDLDQANLLPAPEERGFFVFPDELKTPGPHLTQDFNASILPDRIAYRAGETARFLLRTRNPGSTYLFCVQSQNFRVLRTVTLGAGDQIVELPLQSEDGPNLLVGLVGWRDGMLDQAAVEIFVAPAEVEIEITTDRPHYGPREKIQLTITTRINGQPVPAEVTLAAIDEAIYALEPDQTPNIRHHFTPLRNDYLAGEQSLFVFGLFFRDIGDDAGVGAPVFEDSEDNFAPAFAHAKTRRWFPDTLHWAAHLRTGPEGRAQLEIETPDSLTTWRFTARAVTRDSSFGKAVSKRLTKQRVVLRLSPPRFFTQQDRSIVTAVLHNDLVKETAFEVDLQVEGAKGSAKPRTVTLAAGRSIRLEWPVEADRPGSVRLTARARSKIESDIVQIDVPVRPYGVPLTRTVGGWVETKPWVGQLDIPSSLLRETASLEISVGTSHLDAVGQALPFLMRYPYGCVEQTMSRFLPAVLAGRAMKNLAIGSELQEALPQLVGLGLQRLYAFQHEDGGWGWWKHDETDPAMTDYVLFGLFLARDAGYEVDGKVLEAGIEALQELSEDWEKNPALRLFSARVARLLGGQEPFDEFLDEVEPQNDLERAWLVLAGQKEWARSIEAKLPTAAGVEEVRRAAILLAALAHSDPDDPRIGPLLRWLYERRQGGRWTTTLDTAWAIFALTRLAREETRPEVQVLVDGKRVEPTDGRILLRGDALAPGPKRIEVTRSGGERPIPVSVRLTGVDGRKTIKPLPEGLTVIRKIEVARIVKEEETWVPLESGATVDARDELRVVVQISSKENLQYILLESPLPAGTEVVPEFRWEEDWWDGAWYGRREVHDDRVVIADSYFSRGKEEFQFRIRATNPGTYHILPTTAHAMYAPQIRGRSGAFILRIERGRRSD